MKTLCQALGVRIMLRGILSMSRSVIIVCTLKFSTHRYGLEGIMEATVSEYPHDQKDVFGLVPL